MLHRVLLKIEVTLLRVLWRSVMLTFVAQPDTVIDPFAEFFPVEVSRD